MRKTIIKSAVERGDAHTGWQSGDPSPKLNRRIREVFPTDEVPHKWAHQTQARARNPQGNLFFDGATIYSYRTSWPLASIYTKRGKAPLVLANAARYSMTTSQHQSDVNRAASHLAQIEVPHVLASSKYPNEHRQNFDYLLAEAAEALTRAKRAMRAEYVDMRRRYAHACLRNAALYAGFFGLRWTVPDLPALAWSEARTRAERIENPDPESADKRERAKATRKAAAAIRERKALELAAVHDMARRSDWRLGGVFGAGGVGRYQPVMLRLDGEEIVTSMGARIPAAAAPMVWNLVQLARRTADYDVSRGARRIRIGDYPLDRIDADGTLHAGCHTIPYSELAMMARALNLI
jgi:hypothetical protein